MTGCLPKSKARVGVGRFPTLQEVIPRDQWRTVSIRHQVPTILDQDGTNECCPHAGVLTHMTRRNQQGFPFVLLSPASVYRWINGGRDGGAALGDCLDALATHGALPASVYPMLDWRAALPDNYAEISKGFVAREWDELPTFDHLASAAQREFPICLGVIWSGGGGHAIMPCGLNVGAALTAAQYAAVEELLPRAGDPFYEEWREFSDEWDSVPRVGAAVTVPIANSWSTSYGDKGFGVLPEKQVAFGIKQFGAWCLRDVPPAPGDPLPPLPRN